MALGTRKQRERQESLWVAVEEIKGSAAHPFYARLNELLDQAKFDDFAEEACKGFYANKMGRPGLVPGIYFRCQMVGYFEALLSGYLSNRINWLAGAGKSRWESESWRACEIEVFSNAVTLRICRIW